MRLLWSLLLPSAPVRTLSGTPSKIKPLAFLKINHIKMEFFGIATGMSMQWKRTHPSRIFLISWKNISASISSALSNKKVILKTRNKKSQKEASIERMVCLRKFWVDSTKDVTKRFLLVKVDPAGWTCPGWSNLHQIRFNKRKRPELYS